jgi:hypothetical protein
MEMRHELDFHVADVPEKAAAYASADWACKGVRTGAFLFAAAVSDGLRKRAMKLVSSRPGIAPGTW